MKNSFMYNGKPTVFAFTHVFKDDLASVLYCLRHSAHALAAYHRRVSRSVDGVGIRLNGVIWVDNCIKTSRAESLEKMKAVLRCGGDVLIAPEAVWNLSPNLIVQKIWWGLLDAATSTDANIVPIAVDLVNNNYYVSIGKLFDYAKYSDKGEAVVALRDVMATMAWKLIEMKPLNKRAEITEESWVNFCQSELARVPFLDMATEESFLYRPKGEISLGEVLADMHGIEYKSMAADYEQYKRVERLIDNWTKPAMFTASGQALL